MSWSTIARLQRHRSLLLRLSCNTRSSATRARSGKGVARHCFDHPAIRDRAPFGWETVRDGGIDGLADRPGTGLHRQESAPHDSYPGFERRRPAKSRSFFAFVQADIWRTAACLRGQEALGESLPPDGDQFGFAKRNSPERRVLGSGASLQAVQASLWPKPGQLATRTRDAVR